MGFLNLFFRTIKRISPYVFSYKAAFKERVERYPDVISSKSSDDLLKKYRGILINDISICTACNDCVSYCPPKAINMDYDLTKDGKNDLKKFEIDFGKCIFCSLCVDLCPVSSIYHTQEYLLPKNLNQTLCVDFCVENKYASKHKKSMDKIKKIRSYEVLR